MSGKSKKGGARKGAGRPRKATGFEPSRAQVKRLFEAKLAAESDVTGKDLVEFLENIALKCTELPIGVRMDAAKIALPFRKSKIVSHEHTGKNGGPIAYEDISDNEAARRIALVLQHKRTPDSAPEIAPPPEDPMNGDGAPRRDN